ncbi:MAG: dihydroorotate dehydrogenase [Nitrososphaera sp.]
MQLDAFKASLDPALFRIYRRYLYSRHKATDHLAQPEVVHEKAKEILLEMTPRFSENAQYFDPGDKLSVRIGSTVLKSPVGLAAGFDKDCDMLAPMSYVFGFLNPGSVLLHPHSGNPQKPKSGGTVRIAVDNDREAIINAQGYPHKGLEHVVKNLKLFSSQARGHARILLNFSGITDEYTEDAVLDSCKEIITRTALYVDFGYEDNRTSPNTDFNKVLQKPEFTKKMIDLMNSHVPSGKLKASKISPYTKLPPTEEEKTAKMESIRVFYENGGEMVTLGNTRPVGTKNLKEKFGRPVAGESGRPLLPYMLKLVEDVHVRFPSLSIVACGGIFSGQDAWRAYEKGATLVSLYTALTFRGFGVVKEIHTDLKKRLAGASLMDFIDKRDSKIR